MKAEGELSTFLQRLQTRTSWPGGRRRSARSHHPDGQEFIRVLNQHRSARGLQFGAAAETP
jgi:hypothetical protein